ncbi:MAG: C4-type zinc ribbon domain-containing protein [Candidatus Omnitrophota bacterium]
MAVPDLKIQLSNLIQLQSLDSQIYVLNEEKTAKPEEIKFLQSAFDEKKKVLSDFEKLFLDLQKQKKEHELELAAKEEGAKKLQSQLYSLKTNKEYSTMLQQIRDVKADASLVEDKIIKDMEDADRAKEDLEAAKKKLQGDEAVFNGDKKKLEDRVKEIDDMLSKLEAQRKQILPGIDAKILSQYERILSNRDGLAIVLVKDNSCKGCNMFVPPQVINLIKMYSNIITCEICNRMLYVDE